MRNKARPDRKRLGPLDIPACAGPARAERNIMPLYQLNQQDFDRVACEEAAGTGMQAVAEREAPGRCGDELVFVFFAGEGAQLGVAEGVEFVERMR